MLKNHAFLPRLSEKAYGSAKNRSVYVFDVPKFVNKQSVAKAIESEFKVEVLSVNMLNVKGKAKRTIYKRSRPVEGRQAAVKRAYVTLKPGSKLPVYSAIDEAEAKAKEAEAKAEKGAK